ncbi:recombinase family protein [Rhizobium ruizarguesonis]|uniref:recombinase family protein n=1 Tax=Rhizobium ruizarguesonis TaxID=2081791 RepID=UPI00296242EA|nr:recombinase family protein [Rhizobium ruizarguesonis]
MHEAICGGVLCRRASAKAALDFVREGDTLVVTRLDRLARSTSHLLSQVEDLDRKSVALRILDFGGGGRGCIYEYLGSVVAHIV